MRGERLIKFFNAFALLARPDGTTVNEMARELDIDRKSVYRLTQLMENLGVPIIQEKIPLEKEQRWKILRSYVVKLPNMDVPDIRMSLEEVLAMYMVKGQSSLFRGTDFEKTTDLAYGKLGVFLPKEVLRRLDKIKALFVPPSEYVKDYTDKEETINTLTDAILQQKTCRVKYHSFHDNKIREYRIDPLHFFENDGGLYIYVNTTDHGNVRTLAVERILELSVTEDTFDYPPDFDAEALLASAFDIIHEAPMHVKIWFSAELARYIEERRWTATQTIEKQPDGSILFSMTTSGRRDIRRWVLSYGAHAKLLEPEELRREIMDELEEARKNYS